MMSEPDRSLKVMIIGGSGVFGSRLAELACEEPGVQLTLAGRNTHKLARVADRLAKYPAILRLDRDTLSAADIALFDLVIDAAGPFQQSHSRVIEACLTAHVPYADLADGREFVAAFPRFDAAAKEAGIPLITGVSSIPALSHAVLDHLTADWHEIEAVRIGIYPGNRAPRGKSVVEAILSYVGKPVRVFREGAWRTVPGWGLTHREQVPQAGRRWASVCDTPEQDLLVERYRPTRSAEFYAGLELGLLHLGLAGLSQLVRFKLLPSLRPFAAPMLWMAERLLAFGSDRGAMTVKVSGVDETIRATRKLWVLQADANHGPYVPVLATLALIRRFRDGTAPAAGASACAGLLRLDEFEGSFARFGIRTDTYDLAPNPAEAAPLLPLTG